MLMRTDPFRDFDRLAQQVLGTTARPAVMPMDAWREGDRFIVEFDLAGVDEDSLDLDVERNVLTVHARRPDLDPNREMVSADARAGYSAGSCSWARPSTPRRSRPAIAAGCCG